MLTLKDWDAIADRLEPQVMPKYGEKEQTYIYMGIIWWAITTHERLWVDN